MNRLILCFFICLPLLQSCKPDTPPEPLDIYLKLYTLGGAARIGDGVEVGNHTLMPVAVQDGGIFRYALIRFAQDGKVLAQHDATEQTPDCRFISSMLSTKGRLVTVGAKQDKPALWVNDTSAFSVVTDRSIPVVGFYYDVIEHKGNIYACGQSLDPQQNNQIELLKLDADGQFVKQSRFGTLESDGGIALASDGDKLMLLAYSYGLNKGDRDFWLIQLDENLDTVQSKVFGGAGYDQPACMLYENGHFWLGGHSTSFNNNNHDAYLLKVTPQLQLVWEKAYEHGDHEGIDRMLFLSNGNLGMVSYGDMMVQSGLYLEVKRDGTPLYQKRYEEITGFSHLSEDNGRRVMWGTTRFPIDLARVSDDFP